MLTSLRLPPVAALLLCALLSPSAAWPADPSADSPVNPPVGPMAEGDAAWARRAEGHQGGRAMAGPIDAALAAYEKAVAARPDDLEGYWKVLRAIHFKGEYVARGQEEKQQVFGRGKAVSEAALDRLARRVGGRVKLDALSPAATAKALGSVPGAVQVFIWSGVDWGLWGDAFGKMAAARQGVGDRIRHYGEVAVAMDEGFERASPHRLLGRLHSLAPKIPFITGWVDRGKAVAELRRAVQLGPDDGYNQLYLAEALLEHQPEKKAEALAILRRLLARPPAPDRLVEEESVLAQAKIDLAREGG